MWPSRSTSWRRSSRSSRRRSGSPSSRSGRSGSPRPTSPSRRSSAAASHHIDFQISPNVDIGMLYILSIGSLGVYGVILAGWSSNSKFAFLGGLRSSAQLISYEIPLGMSILGMVLITGSLDLNAIINWQDRLRLGDASPSRSAFLLFLISGFAETNRLPVRPPRGRAGAGRRVPHRILGDEVRDVLPRRIPAHHHRQLPDRDPLLRRLGPPLRPRTSIRPAGSPRWRSWR